MWSNDVLMMFKGAVHKYRLIGRRTTRWVLIRTCESPFRWLWDLRSPLSSFQHCVNEQQIAEKQILLGANINSSHLQEES